MLRWLAVLFALLLATPAQAHPAPFSYLDIHLRGGQIEGTLVVHAIDAAHDLGVATPDEMLGHDVLEARRGEITALIAPRLDLRSTHRLTPQWGEIVPLPDKNALMLSFTIPGEMPGALTLDADLFPYDPAHQTFVNIYEAGKLRQQWIFNKDSAPRTHYLGTSAGAVEVMKTFVPAGFHHILIGADHLLFLIGLLLLGGNWRTLVRIVTAFTIGHSVTLSLAALDIVTLAPSLVEPAIALTIIVVGADNLLRGQGRDLRAWMALTFGLIHGFGFAGVLKEFGLPQEALGWSLFSFNLGVELGQLGVVLLVAPLLVAIRRTSPVLASRVTIGGSIIVIIAGTWWFIQRVFLVGGIL